MVHLHKNTALAETNRSLRVNVIYRYKGADLSSVKYADFEKQAKKLLLFRASRVALKSKMFS
jgi:hypothetical protein